jgi:hypothetical protein
VTWNCVESFLTTCSWKRCHLQSWRHRYHSSKRCHLLRVYTSSLPRTTSSSLRPWEPQLSPVCLIMKTGILCVRPTFIFNVLKKRNNIPRVCIQAAREIQRFIRHHPSKAVPLLPMHKLWGKGAIAPTHSWPRHYMGWVVSVTCWPRFGPGESTPGTHRRGGWVGLRAGLDTEARGKIFFSCRGSSPAVQSVVRH